MDLEQFLDKTVVLHMMDGETAKVRVDFVDKEYEDIIVKVPRDFAFRTLSRPLRRLRLRSRRYCIRQTG